MSATGEVKASGWVLPVVLGLVAVVNFFTMAGEYYAGDNFTPRAEAINLVMSGQLGIDYARRPELEEQLSEGRGKYIYENDDKQRFFSKYGFAYTLLYLPPVLAEKLHAGHVELFSTSRSLRFALNVYHVVFAVLIAWLLFLVAAQFTSATWIRVCFTLSAIYATYMWNYLRSEAADVYLLTAFLAFFLAAVRFSRELPSGAPAAWRRLLWAGLALGAVTWMKAFHCLLIPIYWTWALLVATPAGPSSLPRRVLATARTHHRRLLVCLVAPSVGCFLLILAVNRWRFGLIFNLGYGQFQEGSVKFDRFSLEFVPQALSGFFLTVKWNPFLHFPLLAFGLAGLPAFWHKFRREYALVLSIVVVALTGVSLHRGWNGEWCYGPRHMFAFLPLLSLPFLETLRLLRERMETLPGRTAAVVLACVLAISTGLQVWVNSVPFFAYHHLKFTLAPLGNPDVDRYFDDYHLALVASDLIAHRQRRRTFPPLALLDRKGGLDPAARGQLERQLDRQSVSNYFFATAPRPHVDLATLASEAMKQDRLADAVEHWRAMLAMPEDPNRYPPKVLVRLWLAGALGRLGRLYEAISELDSVLRSRPDLAQQVLPVADAWAKSGRPVEAATLLRVVTQRAPAIPEAHFGLAELLAEQGQIPEAARHYQEALKLRTSWPPHERLRERLGLTGSAGGGRPEQR